MTEQAIRSRLEKLVIQWNRGELTGDDLKTGLILLLADIK